MFISKHEKVFTIILLILCAIFFFNIGYAKTSDNVDFNKNNKEFDIVFKNGKVIQCVGVDQSNTYINTSKDMKNINLSISDLEYPGAGAEFSIDIINQGTVDAKIESIVANGFENSNVVKFILENRQNIENKMLEAGEEVTIYFMIVWDENSTSMQEESFDFNIEVNCVQAI